MPNVLVVGSTRGLGASIVDTYSARDGYYVFGTSRSSDVPDASSRKFYVSSIDVSEEAAGQRLATEIAASGKKLDVVIISAGYFGTEDFETPNWDKEIKMYTTSSIGPVFIVHHLVKAGLLGEGSKIILVSSESGSITLRHAEEGGGNYGHHASKAALNMIGKLLSLDLREKKVAVGIVHPGFMRTEMTKSVGFDKFWEDGGGKFINSRYR